jgi:hypothetical protein
MQLDTALLTIGLVSQALLAFDRLAHRADRRIAADEATGTRRIVDRLANEEEMRLLRAEAVDKRFHILEAEMRRVGDEVQRLHEAASDYGDQMQRQVSDMNFKFLELREQIGRMDGNDAQHKEWVMVLRRRTHGLANAVNAVILRITLLETGRKSSRPMDPIQWDFGEGDLS